MSKSKIFHARFASFLFNIIINVRSLVSKEDMDTSLQ